MALRMKIWLALLVAPILALTDQSIALSMATWMCAKQHEIPMHALHVSFAALIVATTLVAWRLWRATAGVGDETIARRHFLAGLAAATGLLSALVVVAMWIPNWLLSPCWA
jgi:hypothetical protein